MLMDLESKAFKIALKELPKEYKMDEKKVFNTGKAVKITSKAVKKTKPPSKAVYDKKPIKDKKPKKNITKKYKSKK